MGIETLATVSFEQLIAMRGGLEYSEEKLRKAEEATIAAVAAGNVAHGVVLSSGDRERLMQAAGRIRAIAREVAA